MVCIIGTVFAPLDIISKHPKWKQGFLERTGCCGVYLSRNTGTAIRILVILAKDIPQMLVFAIYVNSMGMFEDGDAQGSTLTIISFLFSVLSLLWSLHDANDGCRKWGKRGATAVNKRNANATEDEIERCIEERIRKQVGSSVGDADLRELALLELAADGMLFATGEKVVIGEKVLVAIKGKQRPGLIMWKGVNPEDGTNVVGVDLYQKHGDCDGRWSVTGKRHFTCLDGQGHGIYVSDIKLDRLGETDNRGAWVCFTKPASKLACCPFATAAPCSSH